MAVTSRRAPAAATGHKVTKRISVDGGSRAAASPAAWACENSDSAANGAEAAAPEKHVKHTQTRARANKAGDRVEKHDGVFTTHRGAPKRVRVYVLTYFFSSLTIDRWRVLWGTVPIGWIFSSLAEWFGLPIVHTNVQVR